MAEDTADSPSNGLKSVPAGIQTLHAVPGWTVLVLQSRFQRLPALCYGTAAGRRAGFALAVKGGGSGGLPPDTAPLSRALAGWLGWRIYGV